MTFKEYLGTHYRYACDLQRSIVSDSDMVQMIRCEQFDHELVESWMVEYGLLRGIGAVQRNQVIQAYLQFLDAHSFPKGRPAPDHLDLQFKNLLAHLHIAVNRNWVSAASKLLWCIYPNHVVIFDAFVYRTVVVLQNLDPHLGSFLRVGGPPANYAPDEAIQLNKRREKPILQVAARYQNFSALVLRLRDYVRDDLSELRKSNSETYPYDIRILDKILWMIGDPKQYH